MNTPTITELSITEYLNFVLEKSEGASKTDKFSDGKATMREVLEELICDLKHPTFNRRLGRFLERNQRVVKRFENAFHEKQFKNQIENLAFDDGNYLAAMYLLTADRRIWGSIGKKISQKGISYDLITKLNSDEEYVLFQVAKDIIDGTKHVTLSDISNAGIVKPKMFLIICKAISIYRYGIGAVGITFENEEEEVVTCTYKLEAG